MAIKNLKRIPYYISVALLTGGASLTIGLLSFGGMFSLWPIWSLALATVVLSASYEGDIYIQNIKSGLNKLFLTPNYLKNHLANEFLKNNFPLKDSDNDKDHRPQFFKDYEEQLLLLNGFKNKKLSALDKKRKKKIEDDLLNKERWFAEQLFLKQRKHHSVTDRTEYAAELQDWLEKSKPQETKEVQDTLTQRRRLFFVVGGFSVLSAVFMGIGTTYLLSETLAVIPLLGVLSATIPPAAFIILAAFAGLAYGLLIYNAVTDMINNKTLQHLLEQLTQIRRHGLTLRHVVMTAVTVLLVLLAIALTACTAGTWWTVARQTTPLLSGLLKLPGFIMKIMNPIFIGIASLFFNWQNTAETLKLTEEFKKSPLTWLKEAFTALKTTFSQLPDHENWLQIINPPRLILKLTFTPLRILLFLGHLASIAVTGDRMPSIPQVISALFGFINEGFEDAHYFFGQKVPEIQVQPSVTELINERLDPETQAVDFPTRVLKSIIFKPIYWLAATWDCIASKLNPISDDPNGRRRLSYSAAKEKQTGQFNTETADPNLPPESPNPNQVLGWQRERFVMKIEQFKQAHLSTTLIGHSLAKDKMDCLSQLQVALKQVKSPVVDELKKTIVTASDIKINGVRCLQAHRHPRFFSSQKKATASEAFLAHLMDEFSELPAQQAKL